jgi:alpha-amylase
LGRYFPLLMVVMVDRNKTIGEPIEIKSWLDFKFPGRTLDKYSGLRWHWYHFTGIDWVSIPYH